MSRDHLPRRMLFVLPPISEQGGAVVPSHHPIMTASLAAVARKAGAEVHVIDAALQGLSPHSLAQQITLWAPDWVGFVPYEYRRELSEQSSLSTISELRAVGWKGEAGLLNSALNALPPRRAVEAGKVDFVLWRLASLSLGSPRIKEAIVLIPSFLHSLKARSISL